MKSKKITSTGERLIPELNKGASFFYEHLARYIFSKQLVEGKTVLDVACGTGYGTHILAEYGQAKKVVGLDISPEAIEYANFKYKTKKVQFQVDNAEKLTTQKAHLFEVGVSFETIEHLTDQEAFLHEIKRVLTHNGIFIVSTPNKYTYPEGNTFHTKELYPEEFEALLLKYFKSVTFYHQTFEIAQTIKQANEVSFQLEESFATDSQEVFSPALNPKKSQYILAVCSDKPLPSLITTSLHSHKVDGFDFSEGVISLGKQFQVGIDQINHLNHLLEEKNKENGILLESLGGSQTTLQENIRLQQDLAETNMRMQEEIKKNKTMQKGLSEIDRALEEDLRLREKIHLLTNEIAELEATLEKLKSAKFFQLWQLYNKCKFTQKSS